MENTKIQWAEMTFNPWEGCSKVSPGCANCYAEERANRLATSKWGPQGTRVIRSEAFWRLPLKWNREAAWCGNPVCKTAAMDRDGGRCVGCGLVVERPRVFCASLADVFEDWQGGEDGDGSMTCYRTGEELSINQAGHVWPMGWPSLSDGDDFGAVPYTMSHVRDRLFRLIDATPNLDWLLVTKRPGNINRFTPARNLGERTEGIAEGDHGYYDADWPFFRPNVWHLTSVENQATADERIPELLKVKSACLGLSMEPLLEGVELVQRFADGSSRNYLTGQFHNMKAKGENGNPDFTFSTDDPNLPKLGWAIVGGESGRKARPCDITAVKSVVDQCRAAKVPIFVKQLGAVPVLDEKGIETGGWNSFGIACKTNPTVGAGRLALDLVDKKGGDPGEWPEQLRIREFPTSQEYRR